MTTTIIKQKPKYFLNDKIAKKIAGMEKMNLFLTDEQMLELDQKHYIEVGEEKKMREIAMKMYNKKYNFEEISNITNLSIKEIQKIVNNN